MAPYVGSRGLLTSWPHATRGALASRPVWHGKCMSLYRRAIIPPGSRVFIEEVRHVLDAATAECQRRTAHRGRFTAAERLLERPVPRRVAQSLAAACPKSPLGPVGTTLGCLPDDARGRRHGVVNTHPDNPQRTASGPASQESTPSFRVRKFGWRASIECRTSILRIRTMKTCRVHPHPNKSVPMV